MGQLGLGYISKSINNIKHNEIFQPDIIKFPTLVSLSLEQVNNIQDITCGDQRSFILMNDGDIYICGWFGYISPMNRCIFNRKHNKVEIGKIIKIICSSVYSLFLNNKGKLWIEHSIKKYHTIKKIYNNVQTIISLHHSIAIGIFLIKSGELFSIRHTSSYISAQVDSNVIRLEKSQNYIIIIYSDGKQRIYNKLDEKHIILPKCIDNYNIIGEG